MRLINTILISHFFFISGLFAQGLAAYSDYHDHFFIFDSGKQIMAEELEVEDFAVGGEYVLFTNVRRRVKLYYKGEVTTLEDTRATSLHATDHLAAYTVFKKLVVVDKGKPKTLSYWCPLYKVEDSLLVFYDRNLQSLRVYYNGFTDEIENGILGFPASNLKSGDNIVAYISLQNNDFKIYYKGVNHTILHATGNLNFKAGRDVVAYIDPIERNFKVFYKGEIGTLENFIPGSFIVGDEFVAYIDELESFKIFNKGEKTVISGFPPQFYKAEDNLLVYDLDGYFNVFCEGVNYELETYVPYNYKLDGSTVVYIDQTGRSWAFTKGEKQYLLNDVIKSFDVYRDLVLITPRMGKSYIYYNGNTYRGMAY